MTVSDLGKAMTCAGVGTFTLLALGWALASCGGRAEGSYTPSGDPRVVLAQPVQRVPVWSPAGALVWVPRGWVGWTPALEAELLAEVDSTQVEGGEGPPVSVGTWCASTGWEIWVGPPMAAEGPGGRLVTGWASTGTRTLVCAWTLTAYMPSQGGRRLAALSHEARHARRWELGLPACWPGHGEGCGS